MVNNEIRIKDKNIIIDKKSIEHHDIVSVYYEKEKLTESDEKMLFVFPLIAFVIFITIVFFYFNIYLLPD